VTRLLGEAGVSLGSLDAIAFGAGPGAFTGLRVACGVAQGLAFGADLPVVAVGTLEALAETHFAPGANGPDRVVAALDARMHECYWAELQRHGADWRLLRGPVLCAPAAVPLPAGAGWTGIGDAFAVFAEALATRLGDRVVLAAEVARYPEAAGVARLGALRWRAGAALPPEHAHPLYVRDKVALTAAERAAR
jgi:tRNA threonylcarbamoyladenosine biosynthesis protein TsaB